MRLPDLRAAFAVVLALSAAFTLASPNQTGQSGFIQMPSGRLEPDGTMNNGVSFDPIYQSIWSSVTVLPWMEVSARFTRIAGVSGGLGSQYGDYKDKAFDAKFSLLSEGVYHPSVVVGVQDFLGTGIFKARYLATAKRIGNFDLTLGYGQQRIDGLFGGVRYDINAVEGLSLTAEYNAFDYAQDFGAATSGAAERSKGVGVGLDYRWGWLGSQLAWQDQRWGGSAYLSVPLQAADFIPKYNEPRPYTETPVQADDEQWQNRPEFQQRLLLSLRTQDFARVGIDYHGKVLRLRLTNSRISHSSRALGRAARTALALGPSATERIEITYTQADLPVITAVFNDVYTLNAYFKGMVGAEVLMDTVHMRYASTGDLAGYAESSELLAGLEEGPKLAATRQSQSGHSIAIEGRRSPWYDVVNVAPRAGFYFNDPSGALHYELIAEAAWAKLLSRGLSMDATLAYTVLTDMDEVRQPSNSRLPHVRSDIAKYRQGSRFKLTRLMLNQVWPLAERTYVRVGAGLYEEMFGGAGIQGMYVWPGSAVALDLSVDTLKQRDYSEVLRFVDYSAVTTLAALHVRLPYGLTTTLRAGRFLAGDDGVRVEFKRRFRSGYEIGGWYTRTNANDVTTPGSPGDPYQDKGLYFSVPLTTLLTSDTSAEGSYSLRPWTRDGGQMVSPALDLYELLEKPLMLDYPELKETFVQRGHL